MVQYGSTPGATFFNDSIIKFAKNQYWWLQNVMMRNFDPPLAETNLFTCFTKPFISPSSFVKCFFPTDSKWSLPSNPAATSLKLPTVFPPPLATAGAEYPLCPPNCERPPPLLPPVRTTDPSASKREHRTKPRPKCLALARRRRRRRRPSPTTRDDSKRHDPQHPAESKTPSMSFPFLSSPNTRVVVVSVVVVVANNKGALSSGDDDDDDAPFVPVGRSHVVVFCPCLSKRICKASKDPNHKTTRGFFCFFSSSSLFRVFFVFFLFCLGYQTLFFCLFLSLVVVVSFFSVSSWEIVVFK